MTVAELRSALQKKKFSPIYLLAGEEDFLIDESIHLLVDYALDAPLRNFNLDVVYGSKSTVPEVVALASAFPMMSERRLVVVKEAEKLARTESDQQLLGEYLHRPLESTILVFVSVEGDLRRKPLTDIRKHGEVVNCKSLPDRDLPLWIEAHAKQMGKVASSEACAMLQAYVGNSLRVLHSELEKLVTFIGDRAEITAEDVTTVVGATRGYTVFELQDSIGARDIGSALRIMERMMQANEPPVRIIAMLTRFFVQLWKIQELRMKRSSEAEIASLVGVHHYYIKKYIAFQANFSPTQLERAFRALLEADSTLKSTSKDPKLVMELLLYDLINGGRQQQTVV